MEKERDERVLARFPALLLEGFSSQCDGIGCV